MTATELFEQNQHLLERYCSRYELTEDESQDLAMSFWEMCLSHDGMCNTKSVPWVGLHLKAQANKLIAQRADMPYVPVDISHYILAAESLFEAAFTAEMQEAVHKALTVLTKRERYVLANLYGLGSSDPMTLAECGRHINRGRECVRQIEGKAFRKLRNRKDTRKLVRYLW